MSQKLDSWAWNRVVSRVESRLAELLTPPKPDAKVAGELRELARQKAEAEAAARAKTAFVANVSHELEAPLNGILCMTDLALQTELSPAQHDYVSKIQLAAEHLLGIIHEVVDYSRLEAGKVEVERAELDLERTLGHVVHLFGEQESAKGIEPVIDLALDVPRSLVGDARHLQRVLLELCSYVARLGASGEIVVRCVAERRSPREALLRFSVRHTALDLTEEQTEPFTRAEITNVRGDLGLVIAKRLVALMGGESGVAFEAGHGTELWFTLRFGVGGGEVRRALLRSDLRNVRALVVDDNDVVRTVLLAMLGRMGFRALGVPNGLAAVSAVRDAAESGAPLALVFLDWQMPELDGLETAHRIRALGLANPPRIIMVTAYGKDELSHQALEAGVDQVITKPVSPSVLLETALLALRQGECLEAAESPRSRPITSRPPPPFEKTGGDTCLTPETPRCAH